MMEELVLNAVESRKPAMAFGRCRKEMGDDDAFAGLDAYLGDEPDALRIRRIITALSLPKADLAAFSDACHPSIRRVARLVLHYSTAGVEEDPRLHKGLYDPVARIRADAARFCGTGKDRTRLYNQLVRLLREDPDARVRRSAGLRLSASFADLYALDFQGLPDFSRMLVLDALEGKSRVDEERAVSLLNSSSPEAAFRAARRLCQWGTLRRLFDDGGPDGLDVLEKASHLGVVDYLGERRPPADKQDLAVRLAGQAGRDDMVRRILHARPQMAIFDDDTLIDIRNVETVLKSMEGLVGEELILAVEALPLKAPRFKKSVEAGFPPPDRDGWSVFLFQMARTGRWTDWSARAAAAIEAPDPDIRRTAALCLADIDPKTAIGMLPPLLSDPIDRVRRAAATGLAALPSGEGGPSLAHCLTEAPEDDLEPVIQGIRDAGGAALARCVVDNAETLGKKAMGRLLKNGLNRVGVELLVDGFTGIQVLKSAMKEAGPKAGESMLAAWSSVNGSAGKRLLSWIAASGWARELPKHLEQDAGRNIKTLARMLAPLSTEERRTLLEPVLESAGASARRRIRTLMRT